MVSSPAVLASLATARPMVQFCCDSRMDSYSHRLHEGVPLFLRLLFVFLVRILQPRVGALLWFPPNVGKVATVASSPTPSFRTGGFCPGVYGLLQAVKDKRILVHMNDSAVLYYLNRQRGVGGCVCTVSLSLLGNQAPPLLTALQNYVPAYSSGEIARYGLFT